MYRTWSSNCVTVGMEGERAALARCLLAAALSSIIVARSLAEEDEEEEEDPPAEVGVVTSTGPNFNFALLSWTLLPKTSGRQPPSNRANIPRKNNEMGEEIDIAGGKADDTSVVLIISARNNAVCSPLAPVSNIIAIFWAVSTVRMRKDWW